jgi:hypothetical protein
MTLDELIKALEAEDPGKVLPLGFSNPHSYRWDYSELAFEPTANVTVGEMLSAARSALGATFQGWKGGEYTMTGSTDCHLAEQGDLGEELGPILLSLLLAAGQLDEATRARLAGFEVESARWRKERGNA